mgnify:CR=1 FL=1
MSSAAAASATAASASALFPIEEEALPEKKVRKEEKTISFEHGSGQRLVLPNSTPQNIYTYFDIGTTLEFSAQRPETKRCASLCFCFFFSSSFSTEFLLIQKVFFSAPYSFSSSFLSMEIYVLLFLPHFFIMIEIDTLFYPFCDRGFLFSWIYASIVPDKALHCYLRLSLFTFISPHACIHP